VNAPPHIITFAYKQAASDVLTVTDEKHRRAQYYVVKSGVKDTWSYPCGIDTVIAKYNVDAFNPETMTL
jgi:hypothetical protein